ncbi:MAG TPA: hypothetical protein VJB68_08365, partial [Methylophilaceae bacterium]|nr:hypothetical protein [Methylophilaceae bacterium]
AIDLANNRKALKALRDKIKVARNTAPLFNITLTVHHLESAYRLIWQRYQDGLPPEPIDIEEVKH